MKRSSILPLAALPLLALAACGPKPAATEPTEAAAATAEPTAPSSEWVAENPTEAAVPVNLPNTAATGASAPAPSAPGK